MKWMKNRYLELLVSAAQLYQDCNGRCDNCLLFHGNDCNCFPKAAYEFLKESRDPAVVVALRDGMSLKEARSFVDGVREDIEEAIANGDMLEAEEIWLSDTGLELDYLETIL